jgi:hypothetical protein
MPTYAQLEQEIWWGAETVPDSLHALAVSLRSHFNVGADAIGSKGDNNHLRGYHRSYAWILNSNWCTNRSYSVSRTPGDRHPGNVNWVTGLDVGGMPASELYPMCRRIDAAIRAGRLEKITEWYGTFDGVTVRGYDNISNVSATSDSSHLFHLHLSFDRGRANEDHTDVLNVLIGVDDVTPEEIKAAVIGGMSALMADAAHRTDATGRNFANWTYAVLRAADGFPTGNVDTPGTASLGLKLDTIISKIDAIGVGGSGISEDRVRAIVREELDKSRLTGA